jgi:hypothetical protein
MISLPGSSIAIALRLIVVVTDVGSTAACTGMVGDSRIRPDTAIEEGLTGTCTGLVGDGCDCPDTAIDEALAIVSEPVSGGDSPISFVAVTAYEIVPVSGAFVSS